MKLRVTPAFPELGREIARIVTASNYEICPPISIGIRKKYASIGKGHAVGLQWQPSREIQLTVSPIRPIVVTIRSRLKDTRKSVTVEVYQLELSVRQALRGHLTGSSLHGPRSSISGLQARVLEFEGRKELLDGQFMYGRAIRQLAADRFPVVSWSHPGEFQPDQQ